MFNLSLRYIFAIFFLTIFALIFLSSEYLMPYLKEWKSKQLLGLSKVYQDESISNESNLLQDGVRKARIASLLDPQDFSTRENFLSLLYRSNPAEALQRWALIVDTEQGSEESRSSLLDRSIKTLKQNKLSAADRRISGEIAINQLNKLLKEKSWINSPDNALLAAELLAETGEPHKAFDIIQNSIINHPTHAQLIFLLTRLTVHLKQIDNVAKIGKKLAELATRNSQTGVEAIRHMTLLHILNPLSEISLNKCEELLRANSKSQAIDFMRIYALQFQIAGDSKKESIIASCAEQFDLEQTKDLIIFCRWLGRLGAFQEIVNYLSSNRAKVEEELFKLRMNALAQINDLESIHFEVNNAPIIPERWRLVIESRAFALEGNYKEAIKVLDRLLPVLGSDPRLVRNICDYLENSKDIKGLTHILNKLTKQPIHESFALKKLMQHQSASASLEELLGWMEKLSKLHGNDPFFSQSYLYFELLDPLLPSPSQKLSSLIAEAKKNFAKKQTLQCRITLALAQLRNNLPDQALVALGDNRNWRNWQSSRPAWTFIAAQVYALNHDTEKSLILKKNTNFSSMNKAEKESLSQLFPNAFPIIQ